MNFKFTLEEIADFICEYTQDGKRTEKRDVLDWFGRFERKCGRKESLIRKYHLSMRVTRNDKTLRIEPIIE